MFTPTRLQGLLRALAPLWMMIRALMAGAIFCTILSLLIGVGPSDLFLAFWKGAWGGADAAATSIGKVTPLLLTGLAVALAYRVKLLNIGCEGQLTLGALAAATFATHASRLPWFLLAPLAVFVGAFVGAAWAFPAGWLRRRWGVHEVISTLMLNYLAIYLAEYLVLGPLGDGTSMGRTSEIPQEAVWHPIWHLGTTGVTLAPFLALALGGLAQLWLSRTVWGYEATAVGSNALAARSAGIHAERWQMRIFILSGALAGLAGALEVMTVHHRFYRAFSPGYGFDGITAAFLVEGSPGWIWLSALLLASLRAADKWLQLSVGVSPNVILTLQAVLLISVACRPKNMSFWKAKVLPAASEGIPPAPSPSGRGPG